MAVIITSQDPFHEVSPDSNGLFHECTDEEREEAFKKLLHRNIPDRDDVCATMEQEQQDLKSEYIQINNNQNVQPAMLPQNINSQNGFNGMMNNQFQQQGEQKEKYRHKYISIPFDDSTGCVTYVVKVSVNAGNRLSMDRYSELSRFFREERSADTVDIAGMYIKSVNNCDKKYRIDVDYINANNIRQNKIVFVDKEDCINSRIVEVLKKEGIFCFSNDFSQKKISEYLYRLILSKTGNRIYNLPEYCGFNNLNEKLCFVSEEYCIKNKLPVITDKSFEVETDNNINSEMAEEDFFRMAFSCNLVEQFVLLNMIRVAGLLSTPLYWCGIKFNRIVFINGNFEKISKYLQIYNRNNEIQRPYSVNVKKEILEKYFDSEQDNVVMLEDSKNDSAYLKKNGIDAVEYLSNMIFDHVNSDYANYNFLTVVFSERLGQLMQSEKALVLNYSGFEIDSGLERKEIFAALYYLDKLIIERVCSDSDDYKSCTVRNYSKYNDMAWQYGIDGNTFACLMLAYHEIVRQYKIIDTIAPEKKMCSYLVRIMKESDNTYNGGSISDEFISKINSILVSGKLELVENSSLNNCYGSTGSVPVVFNDDGWLYFTPEAFEYAVSKVALANNANSVRKALLERGLLKVSENMTYKATLYDSKYSGKLNVTAVSIEVLSDEALKMQKGGMFNYTPCRNEDDNDRILIGTDEKERNVYWSIKHEELSNRHMLVNGISGAGKSTAVNLIVKELFSQNQNIVYVDFSRSDTPERLERNGFDRDFQENNMTRINIDSVLENSGELETALDIMIQEKQILLFEKEKYDKTVEEFLTLLYDMVTADSTLSIFLVIDEVHELDYHKGSPLYNIMEKGRGNGISLIGIFQGSHETKPKQYSMMNQSEIRLIFKLGDQRDAEYVAKSNELKPPGKFVEKIRNLKKRHCLVIGSLENIDGELENNRFIEVAVPDTNS